MTKFPFWQARLDAKEGWFDATKTWTAQQRDLETCRLWADIRHRATGVNRLVDFGAGLQRFRPHATAGGIDYLAVDVLPALASDPNGHSWFHLFDGRTPIPQEIDGDVALYCLVIQHLDDADTLLALNASRAKTVIIIDGAWKSDGYTMAREWAQYEALLQAAGCGAWSHDVLQTPLVRYKVNVGLRP